MGLTETAPGPRHARHPPVARLLRCCRPSAVSRTVAALVVDPVDRVLWRWSCTHVLPEPRKAGSSEPHGVYADPSPTVLAVAGGARVRASPSHPAPHTPLRCLAPAVVEVVRSAEERAAARAGVPRANQINSADELRSAGAFEPVVAVLPVPMIEPDDKSFADPLSSPITRLRSACHGTSIAALPTFTRGELA